MAVRVDKYLDTATGRFVLLTCNVWPATDIAGYVAECPALGVTSQGATIDEAENNIRDAVRLYLTTIDELGELERIFREWGLHVAPPTAFHAQEVPTMDGGRVLIDLFPIRRAA